MDRWRHEFADRGRNGMGTTTFLALDVPKSGGDTLYLSTTAAYNALSPSFREFLHKQYATHSGFSQAAVHEHRERYIREPIETIHPVIRTHPVSFYPLLSLMFVCAYWTRRLQRRTPSTSIVSTRGESWDSRKKRAVSTFPMAQKHLH